MLQIRWPSTGNNGIRSAWWSQPCGHPLWLGAPVMSAGALFSSRPAASLLEYRLLFTLSIGFRIDRTPQALLGLWIPRLRFFGRLCGLLRRAGRALDLAPCLFGFLIVAGSRHDGASYQHPGALSALQRGRICGEAPLNFVAPAQNRWSPYG